MTDGYDLLVHVNSSHDRKENKTELRLIYFYFEVGRG